MSCFLLAPSLAFGQPTAAQNPLKGLSPKDQTTLVRSILRNVGVSEKEMPAVRISPEIVREGGSTMLGVFLPKGERLDNKRLSVSTLVVYENAVTSLGELEIAVCHEYLHYSVEKSPPERLLAEWSAAEKEVLTRFDFSDVPDSIRATVVAERLEMVKPLVAHLYIDEQLLKLAPTLDDGENAFESARAAWIRHKTELDRFYTSPATCYDVKTKRWYTVKLKTGE
jgi:hypothetical protein